MQARALIPFKSVIVAISNIVTSINEAVEQAAQLLLLLNRLLFKLNQRKGVVLKSLFQQLPRVKAKRENPVQPNFSCQQKKFKGQRLPPNLLSSINNQQERQTHTVPQIRNKSQLNSSNNNKKRSRSSNCKARRHRCHPYRVRLLLQILSLCYPIGLHKA